VLTKNSKKKIVSQTQHRINYKTQSQADSKRRMQWRHCLVLSSSFQST